jgi:hypothetical protein
MLIRFFQKAQKNYGYFRGVKKPQFITAFDDKGIFHWREGVSVTMLLLF